MKHPILGFSNKKHDGDAATETHLSGPAARGMQHLTHAPPPELTSPDLSKKYGVAVPSYSGSFGFLPTRVPNDLVLGDPLELQCAKPGEPTDGEVQAAHAAYIAALRELFDAHKAAFGYGDRQLVVG